MISEMPQARLDQLRSSWAFHARPSQIAPSGEWHCWLIISGRGFGKTRAGAEWVLDIAKESNTRVALVGETAADVRDVMIEGESGILVNSPNDFRPKYEPSKRKITWPNGTVAFAYSGDKPDQLRGPQHNKAWADEPSKWRYAQDAWDQLEFGLRLGKSPQVVATTTPRPIALILSLMKDRGTIITRGSTYDNAENLSPSFISRIVDRYEGTRLGRQEIHAEILTDVPGALWSHEIIEDLRVSTKPDFERIAVGVDPAITSDSESNETGIIVVGRASDQHGYVLDDKSLRGTPHEWASAVCHAYYKWQADIIVAEKNQGGEMVEHTIRTVDPNVRVKLVHASRGKYTRAEPISALYEQRRFHHVGMFGELEDQMCTYVPGENSPDRMDALVWPAHELFPMMGQGLEVLWTA